MSTPTIVEVALPLPMDVAGTLLNLLGAAYPDATILPDDSTPSWGRPTMRVKIPDENRRHPAPVDPETVDGLVKEASPAGEESLLARWRTDGIEAVPAEEVAKNLATAFLHALDREQPPNYLEWTLFEPEGEHRQVVVYVCRGEQQTPHALRQQAEDRIAAALAVSEEEHATGPRDFRRGFAHAMRLVREALGAPNCATRSAQ